MQSLPCLKQPILWNNNWNQLLYNLCKKKNHNQFVQASSAVRLCLCFCGFTNMLQPDFFFYNEFLVTLYPETMKYHRSVCCCCCFCGDWWDIGCVMVSKLHAPVWVMHHMTSGHPNYRNILIENLNSTNNKQLWSLRAVKK